MFSYEEISNSCYDRGQIYVGHVWYCGDEYCGCTQAQIFMKTKSKVLNGIQLYDTQNIWEGTYFVDNEAGADKELDALKTILPKEVRDRIQWPE